MAWCMAVNETDDELHDGVAACMAQESLPDSCDSNLEWKRRLCRWRESRDGQRSAAACETDGSFLPYPVRGGVGGG
jgi:hypothetical protein